MRTMPKSLAVTSNFLGKSKLAFLGGNDAQGGKEGKRRHHGSSSLSKRTQQGTVSRSNAAAILSARGMVRQSKLTMDRRLMRGGNEGNTGVGCVKSSRT